MGLVPSGKITQAMHMLCTPLKTRINGMSLLELLVIVCIVALGLTIANSSWATVQASLRLRSTANYLQHLFHQARHTALTRGVDIALCASPDGQRCAATGEWARGWLMFVNEDSDTPPQVDPGEAILTIGQPIAGMTVTGNRQAFVLRPHGQRSTTGTLVLCAVNGSRRGTALIISYTGKPRTSAQLPSGAAVTCP
jgi:type IV fimbrial biogenesis protein FimT